jgi:HNH endonuclease
VSLNAATIEFLLAKGLTGEDILQFAWALEGGKRIARPRAAANDTIARLSSSQRRDAYLKLVERDGERCCDCGCQAQIIWRDMGIWNADDGSAYTKVWPTSNLEVDHKQPLWAGGDNNLINLWLLCVDCHKRKTALEARERRRA